MGGFHNHLHSAALTLGLLNELIEPLPAEPGVAFVAMPFSDGFPELFPRFFAPALRASGYRAIRAWGGIVNEDYQELLHTLMSKCGALLADLTNIRENVLLAVGISLARDDMKVFLIAEKTEERIPSNLKHLPIFRYDRTWKGWPMYGVRRLASYVARPERSRAFLKPGQ